MTSGKNPREHLAEKRRKEELEDLARTLALPQGRKVLYRILERCRVFESIWDPGAKIHYNAGQQDVGHWLMLEIGEAEPKSIGLMMQEAYQERVRRRKEDEELAANERSEE